MGYCTVLGNADGVSGRIPMRCCRFGSIRRTPMPRRGSWIHVASSSLADDSSGYNMFSSAY